MSLLIVVIGNSQANARHGVNPSLQLGEIHNGYLDLLPSNAKFPKIDDLTLYNIAVNYFPDKLNNAGISFSMPTFAQVENMKSITLNYLNNSNPLTTYLNDNPSPYSQKQILLLKELGNYLVATTDLDKLINKLDNFDNNVLNRNDISEVDKQIIQEASAIARKAAEYWNDARLNPLNPYFTIFTGNPTLPSGFPKWPFVILGDVLAFVIGNAILPGAGVIAAGIVSGVSAIA